MSKTQAYYLRVIDRSYPADYLEPIKQQPNSGYELFQAAAKLAERVSLALDRLLTNSFLMYAVDGAYSTGSVLVSHTVGAVGYDYSILAGSKFKTADGKVYVSTADVVIPDASAGPFTVPLRSVAQGWEYDVPGEVTINGVTLPGEITQVKKLVTSVPVIDQTVTVRQPAPFTGGAFPALDLHGRDVGIPRRPHESSPVYKQRIVDAPDTVSLPAITRGLLNILVTEGYATTKIREVGTWELQGVYYDAGSSGDAVPDPARNYAYDMDPTARSEDLFKILLSYAEMRGFLLVDVPPIGTADFGMAFDATDMANAYDTIALDASAAAYDGFPVAASGLYHAIWSTLEEKRAGGVFFDLYLNPNYGA